MLATYEQEAQLCVTSGASYETYLCRLYEQEVLGCMSRKIQLRIKKAQFPSLKTLDNFDFGHGSKSLNTFPDFRARLEEYHHL